MSIVIANTFPDAGRLASPVAAAPNADSSAGSSPAVASADGLANSSSLSLAVSQALAQMRGGAGLAGSSTPAAAQDGFTSSLLASLPGSSPTNATSAGPLSGLYGSSSGQAANPVKLDPSSSTIKLQTSIQNLIAQLDGNGSLGGGAANIPSGLANLQQSFNKLVTAGGGNPSQTSLQSFLKTVAANIQGSMSIGSMFDASA